MTTFIGITIRHHANKIGDVALLKKYSNFIVEVMGNKSNNGIKQYSFTTLPTAMDHYCREVKQIELKALEVI